MDSFIELFKKHHWIEFIGINELLFVLLLATAYHIRIKKLTHTPNVALHHNLFFIGLTLYYIACATPVHIASEHLFSMKMVKASIAYFIVPPLLLAGLPSEMLRPLLWNYRIRKALKTITNPIFSTTMFYGLLFLYLNPKIFLALNASALLDTVSHMVLFFFAIFMWWPVMTPLKDLNPLSDMFRLINLLINGCVLFGIAYPMFLWDEPYKLYQDFAFPAYYSANDDVIIGAITIMFVQKFLIITIAGVIFYKRFKKEDVIDPVNVAGLMGASDPKGQNS